MRKDVIYIGDIKFVYSLIKSHAAQHDIRMYNIDDLSMLEYSLEDINPQLLLIDERMQGWEQFKSILLQYPHVYLTQKPQQCPDGILHSYAIPFNPSELMEYADKLLIAH